MKYPKKIKLTSREGRARRIRKKVSGTMERPRLSISRSLKNIYAQIIDDVSGKTLVGVSTNGPELRGIKVEGGRVEVSKALGKLVAEKAKEKKITKVVFDRGGCLYLGRVKAIAEGAREAGLEF
jgi:large subunit ribosomal protein L18